MVRIASSRSRAENLLLLLRVAQADLSLQRLAALARLDVSEAPDDTFLVPHADGLERVARSTEEVLLNERLRVPDYGAGERVELVSRESLCGRELRVDRRFEERGDVRDMKVNSVYQA